MSETAPSGYPFGIPVVVVVVIVIEFKIPATREDAYIEPSDVITGRRGGFQTRPNTKGLSGYQVRKL